MQTVETRVSKAVPVSADKVWAVLQDFGNLDWAIGFGLTEYQTEGAGVGMFRIPKLANGEELREQLIEHDPAQMKIAYTIVGGNFIESTDYTARVQVCAADSGCEVHWHCTADFPDDAAEQGRMALEGMANGMGVVFTAQFMQGT